MARFINRVGLHTQQIRIFDYEMTIKIRSMRKINAAQMMQEYVQEEAV
jgi:hypothetical protein